MDKGHTFRSIGEIIFEMAKRGELVLKEEKKEEDKSDVLKVVYKKNKL